MLESYLQERLKEKKILLMTHIVLGYPSFEKSFDIIFIFDNANIGTDDLPINYKLYTISKTGKIIASMPFSYTLFLEGYNFFSEGKMDKNLEFETIDWKKEWNVENESEPANHTKKTTKKYKINDDGSIELTRTIDPEVIEEIPEELEFPNPILVSGDFLKGYGEYLSTIGANIIEEYYYYSNSEILDREPEFNDMYSDKKRDLIFAAHYDLVNKKTVSKTQIEIENDILKNTDTEKQFFIKYQILEVYTGEAMGEPYPIELKIIDDYEIIDGSPIVVTFSDFQMGDFVYYTFTTELGYKYTFMEMADGLYNKYKFDSYPEDAPDGIPNPEFVGEKFNISYHKKTIVNEHDGGDEMEIWVIDSIELL